MYGGLNKPTWSESLSALYIVYSSLYIESHYYHLIFLLNGISSCIAHNPWVAYNHSKINIFADRIDNLSIDYSMCLKVIYDYIDVPIRIKFDLFLITLCILLSTDSNFFYRYRGIWIMLLIIQIILEYTFNFYLLTIAAIAGLSKKYEDVDLGVIKVHTFWHIFGSIMFKELITCTYTKL